MTAEGRSREGLRALRRKLSRERAQEESAPPTAPESIIYRRDLPGLSDRTETRTTPVPGAIVPLEKVVTGDEIVAPHGPPYLLVRPDAHELADLNGRVCGGEDLVFLDLETTGLTSSPLFLIGAVVRSDGRLELRQYLARSYAEEVSVISAFAADTASATCLVSFNGKTFDAPFLRARAAATGVTWQQPAEHVDLLHAARRVYKGVLPNCKLQTLERYVCDRGRRGDIPGCEIPEAYHEFVRTGHAARIATVLKHNALDLITLVDLYIRLS